MSNRQTPQTSADLNEFQQRIAWLEDQLEATRKSHHALVNVVDRVGDIFVALDQDWRYRYINVQALQLIGMSADEIVGRSIWELFPQYKGTVYEANYRQAMATQTPVTFEAQGIFSDRWYETTVYPAEEGMTIYSRDVTERKRAENRLRGAHEALSVTLERISDTFISLDHEWRFTYANNRILDILDMEREALIGRVYWDVFPDLVDTPIGDYYRRSMAEQIPLHGEFEGTYPPGRWYEIDFYPSPDGISTFGRDITEEKRLQNQIEQERKKAEAERERLVAQLAEEQKRLRELTETLERRVHMRTGQVQRLANSLLMAEHQERKRISQILHDHIQQMLYSVQWRTHILEDETIDGEHGEANVHIDEIKRLIAEAIHAMRTLTVELSPPVLENEGLPQALTWLATQMQDLHTLQVALDQKGDCQIRDKNLRRLIFQTVRELLFNVVKHAGVKEASVNLQCTSEQIVVAVSDQGVGFEMTHISAQGSNGTGFGLLSIQERLELFGGQIGIESAPGRGAKVSIVLPLSG